MSAIMALQIDSREANWLKAWGEKPPAIFADIPVLITALETGDAKVYCADGKVLNVERKTPLDFLNSIPNDHILDQVSRMMITRRDSGELPFLVITGEITRNPKTGGCLIPGSTHGDGWNWNAVQGMLLTIQEAGVPVIFCAGETDYAECLERLAKRKQTTLINPTREIMPLDPAEQVLCSFDGIGPELAGAILKRCVNPAWALDTLTDLRQDGGAKIPGIADGRKRIIRQTLGLKDNERLAVIAT